ncbi:hypothetical protein [Aliiroseovarius lamellibrachiae]|uniref:hypothetical protein n=1 Tax=Aliiroseovarius lamellibrachiae TaxID=1924933 RepID=UPI001BE04CFC|nr:hypothetical protein [Aliiroseovarius lamellibrachiae]MBT2130108.1 hypothetical protein [Aliiroseovarius lamellibrachiae]
MKKLLLSGLAALAGVAMATAAMAADVGEVLIGPDPIDLAQIEMLHDLDGMTGEALLMAFSLDLDEMAAPVPVNVVLQTAGLGDGLSWSGQGAMLRVDPAADLTRDVFYNVPYALLI